MAGAAPAALRIDQLLWFLRLSPSRALARRWVEAGHIRLNTRRIEKPGTLVKVSDVLTLPMRNAVKIIEIVAVPMRRGPAIEAQSCYRVLDGGATNPIADEHPAQSSGDLNQ